MRINAFEVSLFAAMLMALASCKKPEPPPPQAQDQAPAKKSDDQKKKAKADDDDKSNPSKKGDDDKDDDKGGEDDKVGVDDDKKDPKNNDDFSDEKAGPRTATPTVAEWGAAADVEVTDAKKLGCETRMVREWLRVSCRGKDDKGGIPTAVSIVKGKTGDTLTYLNKAITSLIVPVEPGMKDFQAVYSWEDKSVVLSVRWPQGSKRPDPVGAFDTKNVLPGVKGDEALLGRLCECFKKTRAQSTCDGMLGATDADCDRTYQGDCEKLVECSNFEPGAFPTCLNGFTNGGVGGRCYKTCNDASDCKANEECNNEPTFGATTVCNPTE